MLLIQILMIASTVMVNPPKILPPSQIKTSYLQTPTYSTLHNNPYYSLVCSNEERAIICNIIKIMATNGKWNLLVKYNTKLRKLGKKVEHVYPLKFLECVLNHPEGKHWIKNITNDLFVKNGFIKNLFGKPLIPSGGNIDTYLDAFIVEVYGNYLSKQAQGNHHKKIKDMIVAKKWENLLKYLAK